ncbi:MAG: hypothetical protein A3G18_03475 [Rhodospirillales bacterium RIFCSPLOWO2_12_FULL_58_28]|nr:MAG: hypothetical protein A3H92_01135 [Rhodospirillales bacterium RIFCSPLOWO2_02_FULL_58_16]OHC76829.1 MAG: hypothetical protein A3G18_03475 [Rhodospirillales bacterium RIFCSPLOWO2_12_FULL_58_28]
MVKSLQCRVIREIDILSVFQPRQGNTFHKPWRAINDFLVKSISYSRLSFWIQVAMIFTLNFSFGIYKNLAIVQNPFK